MLQRPRVVAILVVSVLIILMSILPIPDLLLSFLWFVLSSLPVVKLLLGLGLVCFIALLFLSISAFLRRVPENYVDIVSSFGKYKRTLYSGLHVRLPWQKIVERLRVSESLMVCPPQLVPLSYDYDVNLSCMMSYQLVPEQAHLALSTTENWEESLHHLLITCLQASGTVFEPDDFLAWAPHVPSNVTGKTLDVPVSPWERVNLYLLRQMREMAAQWGVQVNWTAIRDVRLAKHTSALVIAGKPARASSAEGWTGNLIEHNYPTEKLTPWQSNGPQVSSGKKREAALISSEADVSVLDEEVFIRAYEGVQNGNITDPQTIRAIALSFESIAQDPKLSEMVCFDAACAANLLYKRASMYEGKVGKLKSASSSSRFRGRSRSWEN
ncbi:MAG: SPFH domain-containing protein [Ktedonobacteraceae bacterium]